MDVLFFSLKNIISLESTPLVETKEIWTSPTSRLSFLFPLPSISASPLKGNHRVWRVLTFCIAWGIQLLSLLLRILGCYQKSYPDQQAVSPSVEAETHLSDDDKDELQELFSQSINYQKFHDSILSWRIGKRFFLNNYNLAAYKELKNSNVKALDSCKTNQEKEFKASVAVYDTIVDCYVNRFLDQHPELDSEEYLPSLQAVALGIAVKNSWEEAVWNADFYPLLASEIRLSTYQKMEIEFLKGIDWHVVPPELYQAKVDERDEGTQGA